MPEKFILLFLFNGVKKMKEIMKKTIAITLKGLVLKKDVRSLFPELSQECLNSLEIYLKLMLSSSSEVLLRKTILNIRAITHNSCNQLDVMEDKQYHILALALFIQYLTKEVSKGALDLIENLEKRPYYVNSVENSICLQRYYFYKQHNKVKELFDSLKLDEPSSFLLYKYSSGGRHSAAFIFRKKTVGEEIQLQRITVNKGDSENRLAFLGGNIFFVENMIDIPDKAEGYAQMLEELYLPDFEKVLEGVAGRRQIVGNCGNIATPNGLHWTWIISDRLDVHSLTRDDYKQTIGGFKVKALLMNLFFAFICKVYPEIEPQAQDALDSIIEDLERNKKLRIEMTEDGANMSSVGSGSLPNIKTSISSDLDLTMYLENPSELEVAPDFRMEEFFRYQLLNQVTPKSAIDKCIHYLTIDVFSNVKEIAVGVLGSLAFGDESNNYIREQGGIKLLIAHICDHMATPVAREYAAIALMRLADNVENRECIKQEAGIEVLIALIKEPYSTAPTRNYAISAIWYLVEDNAEYIMDCGGIELMIELINDPNASFFVKENAIDVLFQFEITSDEYGNYIKEQGGIEALIVVIKDPSALPGAKDGAVSLLKNLALSDKHAAYIKKKKGIEALISLMDDPSAALVVKEAVATMFCSLVRKDMNRIYLRKNGGIDVLIAFIKDPNASPNSKEKAVEALRFLAVNNKNKVYIGKRLGITIAARLINDLNATSVAKEKAVGLLWHLSRNNKNQVYFREQGGIDALIAILKDPNATSTAREEAISTLCNLAVNRGNENYIRQQRGVAILFATINDPDANYVIKQNAFKCLKLINGSDMVKRPKKIKDLSKIELGTDIIFALEKDQLRMGTLTGKIGAQQSESSPGSSFFARARAHMEKNKEGIRCSEDYFDLRQISFVFAGPPSVGQICNEALGITAQILVSRSPECVRMTT
jgi:hypothetical protein